MQHIRVDSDGCGNCASVYTYLGRVYTRRHPLGAYRLLQQQGSLRTDRVQDYTRHYEHTG